MKNGLEVIIYYRIGDDCLRVLILAPHTDDGEFGCGGTIAKHIENGDSV